MQRRVLALVLVLAAACATLPPRDRAYRTIDFTDQRLTAFRNLELRVCNEEVYNKILAAGQPVTAWPPETACAGQLATSAKLTTEAHKKIHSALAEAFALQQKALVLLKTWEEGQPVPAELQSLLTRSKEILDVVSVLAATDQQKELLSLSTTIVNEVQKTIDAIRGGTHAV